MENKLALSASSIKTLEACTWMYWLQHYHKIPSRSNAGSARGTVVHLILELLLNPRHKKYYDSIVKNKTINLSFPIKKLVVKHLERLGFMSQENYAMCDEMILVGLKNDFFGAGSVKKDPEYRFEFTNVNPEYKVKGFIDKIFFYPNETIKIVDYKSSKSKFNGDELSANIQAMVYSLIGYKIFKAKDVTSEFIFLRFPKQPIQEVHPTKEQLEGFEEYLSYLYGLINDFDEQKARGNMAAYNKESCWMCKAGATWRCPYMFSFIYYALIEGDRIIKTSLNEKDLIPTKDQKIVVKHSPACPAWEKSSKRGL